MNVTNNRANILIVDDLPENLHVLVNILRDRYAVTAATTGRRALEIAQREPKPDLILLDIKMPEMDGYAVLNKLRSDPVTENIPVIFISGMGDSDDVARGLRLGVADYIVKPVDPEMLHLRVRTQLDLQHARNRSGSVDLGRSINTQETPTLLLVDDVPDNLHELIAALKHDYQIKVATNGAQALEVVKSESPPDAILLDVMMPGMDGYEVCKRIKELPRGHSIPVIFVTVADEIEHKINGFLIGGADYITKPYNIDEVKARIKTHLELSRLRYFLESLVSQRTEQLRASEEKYRTVADFTHDWEYWISPDGSMRYVSPSCEQLTGYTSAEFTENPDLLYSIVHPDDADEVRQHLLDSSQPDKLIEGRVFRIYTRAGELRWIEHNSLPVHNADGENIGRRATNRDVTERRAAEEEIRKLNEELEDRVNKRTQELAAANEQLSQARDTAEQATQAKSTFLSSMSHEIRTPLNAIIGMADIMRKKGLHSPYLEYLDKIELAGKHLSNLINDILDLSKIEAGKLTMEEAPLALDTTIANVESMLHDSINDKGLSLVVEPLPELPYLLGDNTRLQQVILNYLNNATKFTESGAITLRVRILEDMAETVLLRFEVEDSGIGISKELIAEIFTEFEQADKSRIRESGGTGLGLAINLKLAQLMGGDVGVESKEGEGSTFWLTAMLKKCSDDYSPNPDAGRQSAEQILRESYAGSRVLIVDDEPFNLEIATFQLSDIGMQCDMAENGEQAVEKAKENCYDVILMDVQMPVMDGLEATRRIRQLKQGGDVPVLAMTANVFSDDNERCLEAGMSDFVPKPIDTGIFLVTLLKWLSKQ